MEAPQLLSRMRDELSKAVGREAIVSLHAPNPLLDVLALVALPALFAGGFVVLHSSSSMLVGLAVALHQGIVMSAMGLLNHDLFVHRNFGGQRFARIAGVFLTAPLQLPYSKYRRTHLLHHRFIGTARDTEVYKQDLSTRARRLAFCTLFGVRRAMSGKWADPARPEYLQPDEKMPRSFRRFEAITHAAFFLSMVLLALWRPYPYIYGWFVPLFLFLPLLNTLRILLEHAHIDAGNPRSLATLYRTGWFSRLVFLWDSGDCHMVHHVFPNIPFYRMGRAVEVCMPAFVAWGLRPVTSYGVLLRKWFVDNAEHRGDWFANDGDIAAPPAARNRPA